MPPLQGLHRPSVLARTGHAHVDAVFVSHHSHAPVGVAIAQIPDPGTRVKQGSKVRVLMSSGPPPVAVPSAVGEPLGEAEEAIAGVGLRYALHTVPAPGHTAESVLSESPSAAASVPSGSTVTLTVVAAPQWRPLTTFSGKDAGQSVPFSIRGHRWRLAYTMSYVHTCLLLVVCEGPTATVENLSTASSFGEFEFDEGGGTHYRVFDSGPGLTAWPSPADRTPPAGRRRSKTSTSGPGLAPHVGAAGATCLWPLCTGPYGLPRGGCRPAPRGRRQYLRRT